ncbi:histidinol dehydrogenase [Candidatus Contubernalis alkaliaceticus]|uniref:histidinol dehydrogenase n=1 Tax=Candidatus Contubernalis alkaliaceticus TaxID=338645 RepID=UPI001F4C516C|nr:histidinol dehydrogenase [Candidatus Contubernalis alkalaceticus]UNC92905.1 histidinol dehydrogenase [Candidatus Contubernalis alkalaceticus]
MLKVFTKEEWEKTSPRKNIGSWEKEEKVVKKIIADVRKRGDEALLELALKYDGCLLENLMVEEKEKKKAVKKAGTDFLKALHKALENIEKFHRRQARNSFISNEESGIMLGQMVIPLEKIGAYVPGGTASYPSSVLMNVVPAKIAGVKEIFVCTPPGNDGNINPYTLAAAVELGVEKIYKMGGAQAVAAFAYGTGTVPVVDKIVGPGNIYVTLAKKMVYGDVDIDMLAGPSELLIIADYSANPEFIAADIMSQAEHDPLAANFIVTSNPELPGKVLDSLKIQLPQMNRQGIIEKSLREHSAIITVKDLAEAFRVSNDIAPEHLEVIVENPLSYLPWIKNAGSVFLGAYTPEPLGDYYAGPNHVLPTGGASRFSSGLNVDDFIKKTTLLYYPPQALKEAAEDVILLAEVEGLDAHANTVKVRMKSLE